MRRRENRICSVEGCEDEIEGRGWCNRHYLKWRKYGDPLAGITYGASLQERFWRLVPHRPVGSCWEWRGDRSHGKYGRFWNGERVNGSPVKVMAHRWVYEAMLGTIPEGKLVLHDCDNPGCVNPAHLFLGTQQDNVRDCIGKGRRGRPSAKLTPQKAAEIRARRGEPHRSLAREYGVSKSTITALLAGQTWQT